MLAPGSGGGGRVFPPGLGGGRVGPPPATFPVRKLIQVRKRLSFAYTPYFKALAHPLPQLVTPTWTHCLGFRGDLQTNGPPESP